MSFDFHFGWGGKKRRAGPRSQVKRGQGPNVRAKFDAVQDTPQSRKHWANADMLSPDAAASPHIRRTARSRARYEVANDCYASGILDTLSKDVVGRGPTLQIGTTDSHLNTTIEKAWEKWAKRIGLAGKLRLMRKARAQDGETFGLLVTNAKLATPAKLDLRLIEADQVATPESGLLPTTNAVDGILFDADGNPETYHVLTSHPGNATTFGKTKRDVAADLVMHWFKADRAGQHRGLPEIMPALELFALRRRYTLAVLTSAETAAEIAIFMKTSFPPTGEADDVEDFLEYDIQRGMMMFAPEGWEAQQMKPEQPTTTYEMFIRAIIQEMARPFNMPFNVAAGNSGGYNFASGRLDFQTYFRSLDSDRSDIEDIILFVLFQAWYAEMRLADQFPGAPAEVTFQWFWQGRPHVDPAKEANAQATRLANHTTTLAAEYAALGKDWETELIQEAAERKKMEELGIPSAAASPADGEDTASNDGGDDDAEEESARPEGD